MFKIYTVHPELVEGCMRVYRTGSKEAFEMETPQGAAIICIRRPAKLMYAARKFAVFIDEMKVGGVKDGGEARFEVKPGRHSICVKIDFYTSKPHVINLRPGESASLVCGAKEGMSGLVSAFTSMEDYLYLRLEEDPAQVISATASVPETPLQKQLVVHIDSEEERLPAATEEVRVPKGVKIKVKRSRTVEHTVEIDWTATGEARFEAGFKQIVSGSLRGEISQKQGRAATESETVEYEIEIDGEKCSQYRLTWTDIWHKGTTELQHGGATHMVPFRYRERSELEVAPVEPKARRRARAQP
ncbi:MAG TPA: hypothetical protein VN494_09855 [Patescibacteria group bacterium]|nr:hypothetical protein [Patescibacteria group bacterium]